jgi:hypothetical protein
MRCVRDLSKDCDRPGCNDGARSGALSTGVREGASAFYISGVPLLLNNISRVMPLVAASGKLTVGVYPEWARAGLLMSYSSDLADGFRHAGTYVARILAGESHVISRSSTRARSPWSSI